MANVVFSVVTLCSVVSGGCFEFHVPHPEHTVATCESMMQRDAAIAVRSYNETAAPENRVSHGGFRCQEELNRPTYTIRR